MPTSGPVPFSSSPLVNPCTCLLWFVSLHSPQFSLPFPAHLGLPPPTRNASPFRLHSHRLCHIGTPGCESASSHLIGDPALPYRHTWVHSIELLQHPPFYRWPLFLGLALPYRHTQSLPRTRPPWTLFTSHSDPALPYRHTWDQFWLSFPPLPFTAFLRWTIAPALPYRHTRTISTSPLSTWQRITPPLTTTPLLKTS